MLDRRVRHPKDVWSRLVASTKHMAVHDGDEYCARRSMTESMTHVQLRLLNTLLLSDDYVYDRLVTHCRRLIMAYLLHRTRDSLELHRWTIVIWFRIDMFIIFVFTIVHNVYK
jgi:hypothetical protein